MTKSVEKALNLIKEILGVRSNIDLKLMEMALQWGVIICLRDIALKCRLKSM